MNMITRIFFIVVAFCGSLALHAQSNNNTTSFNILAITDTATTARIATIQKRIAALNTQIADHEKNLNRAYRDVFIDRELELNLREDSVHMAMMSERCELTLQLNDLKNKGMRGIINRLSQIPQRNSATTNPNRKKK